MFKYDGEKIVRWGKKESQFINDYKIYSSAIFKDGRIAIGTALNGIYILDKDGAILQHIYTLNGLSDNNVLSILVDKSQNVWLGLETGERRRSWNQYPPWNCSGGLGERFQVDERDMMTLKPNILVVDDEPAMRDFLKSSLCDRYVVVTAYDQNGNESSFSNEINYTFL